MTAAAEAKLAARVERAVEAMNDDRSIAELLQEYLRDGTDNPRLQAELCRLQLQAAKVRLAEARTWFLRQQMMAEGVGDCLDAQELSLMADALTGGDSDAVRLIRESLRKDAQYRASLARISDWLANGSIEAVLGEGK